MVAYIQAKSQMSHREMFNRSKRNAQLNIVLFCTVMVVMGFWRLIQRNPTLTLSSKNITSSSQNHVKNLPVKDKPLNITITDHPSRLSDIPASTFMQVGIITVCAVTALVLLYFALAWVRSKRDVVAAKNTYKLQELQRKAELATQMQKDWDAITSIHDHVLKEWNSFDKDIQKLLELPAMRNFDLPEVGAVIDALDKAADYRTVTYPEGTVNVQTTEYAVAVKECKKAYENALHAAIAAKNTSMSHRERKQLSIAQQLLKTAMNDTSSISERQLAYSRVMRIMKDLNIHVPEKIVSQIENNTRKLLEA